MNCSGREGLPIVDLEDRLGDFHDTAAIVQNLDLVISCCSSPAHLAGALGVPVWIALSHAADCAGLRGRDDSPWYPSGAAFPPRPPGRLAGGVRADERRVASYRRGQIFATFPLKSLDQAETAATATRTSVADRRAGRSGNHGTGDTLRGRHTQKDRARECPLPTIAETFAMARSHDEAGRLADAERLYRAILEVDGANFDVHYLLGAVYFRWGRLKQASASLGAVLRLKPDHPEAHHDLAVLRARQGQLDEAIELVERARALAPQLPAIPRTLSRLLAAREMARGQALMSQSSFGEAEGCFRRALEHHPNYPERAQLPGNEPRSAGEIRRRGRGFSTIGIVEAPIDRRLGQSCRGVDGKKRSRPRGRVLPARLAMPERSRPSALHARRGHGQAGEDGRSGRVLATRLQIAPDLCEATSSLGSLLARQGRVAEARSCYVKASELQPDELAWQLNIVSLCPAVFQDNEAIEAYRSRLLRDLQDLSASSHRFSLAGLQACDFRPSFNLAFHGRDERPIRAAFARLFGHCFGQERPAGSPGRPRVGIVVTDRHEGIFLRSLGGVVDRMNRDLFDLVVIGSERGVRTLRQAISNPAVSMLAIPGRIDQAADVIRSGCFDLLYYWEVGTDSTNYFLPFYRLAPVQCTSWGIQVTSGIPKLDYYLSSDLVEPADASDHYTEQLVLANTLLTDQERRQPADPGRSRTAT